MVKVNGEVVDAKGKSVTELLIEEKYDEKRVVVEINEVIVPKKDYASVIIKDGDVIEIVSFVGGG
ncbi:MAG: sulfur carrier protein ThiS [Clostridia bacterium]|nr:sulfur carrier protein ThiS [Clostridia bacterium]MBP5593594.1 sulfur carrier protein ThiS [Clostridia bacterium]MBP5648815.1 sulfur carrier protein ThiS [Clostridia bacterium]